MAHCVLNLLAKFIQKLVFGELRASERQHLKDKFWNFIFYKFIFVFGVLNVQYMDEVLLWWAWFTALGFLSLFSQLCKDRFEYVSICTERLYITTLAIIRTTYEGYGKIKYINSYYSIHKIMSLTDYYGYTLSS